MSDGQGGVLASWTIANPNPPPAPQPYQGAYVAAGGGITTYSLPMAPASLTTGNDGLPVNPTLVMGENGIAFVSYGANITSFSLSTGLANWNYQAPSQTLLSLISYSSGGGLVGKMTTTGSIDTVLRFDSGGNATADSWTGSNVDYAADRNQWIGSLSSSAVHDFSGQPIDPLTSLFPTPRQKRLNKANPISVAAHFGPKNRQVGDGGDFLKFKKASEPCSENLGLQDCTQVSGYWLWNLEVAARVYDDASNWSVLRTDQFFAKGQYVDDNDQLQPFSCSENNPDDGPRIDFIQDALSQNLIFVIDAPGPYILIDPDNHCLRGTTDLPLSWEQPEAH